MAWRFMPLESASNNLKKLQLGGEAPKQWKLVSKNLLNVQTLERKWYNFAFTQV